LITLLRTLPTIISALRAGLKDVRAEGAGQSRLRVGSTAKYHALGGSSASNRHCCDDMGLADLHPMNGASTNWYQNAFAGVFVVIFGFLLSLWRDASADFSATLQIPSVAMSIATLMATCAIFFVAGWTAPNYQVHGIDDRRVVCIAAAIAGATSQDLKTGYLVGSTPFWQQMGLLIGVTVSTLAIGTTLNLMNKGLEKYLPTQIPVNIQNLPAGVKVERDSFIYKESLRAGELPGLTRNSDGEYLYDAGTKRIEFQWAQGIGSDKAPAPQARLMATVISGILNQRLPWHLVLNGGGIGRRRGNSGRAFAGVCHRLVSPSRHYGCYVCRSLVRVLVEATIKKKDESEASPGALYSSGLIAAGGVLACLASSSLFCKTRKFPLTRRLG